MKSSLRIGLPVVFTFALAAPLFAENAPPLPPAPTDQQQVDQLRQRIDALEAEIGRLKLQLKRLQQRPGILRPLPIPPVPSPMPPMQHINPDMPNALPPTTQPGRNWQKREYNGEPYYLIPLPDEPDSTKI